MHPPLPDQPLNRNRQVGGRRQKPKTEQGRGRWIRSVPLGRSERPTDLDLRSSLLAHAAHRDRSAPPGPLKAASLRKKIRALPQRQSVLLLVDASDSMGDESTVRMRVAKGVALALLDRAYVNRFRVGMIVFRERDADRVLAPTNSVELARTKLRRLGIGGATPLAAGIELAIKTLKQERIKHPGSDPLLVILSDGEANVPLTPGEDVLAEVIAFGRLLRQEGISSLMINTGSSSQGSTLLRRLTKAAGGDYRQMNGLTPGAILDLVNDRPDT